MAENIKDVVGKISLNIARNNKVILSPEEGMKIHSAVMSVLRQRCDADQAMKRIADFLKESKNLELEAKQAEILKSHITALVSQQVKKGDTMTEEEKKESEVQHEEKTDQDEAAKEVEETEKKSEDDSEGSDKPPAAA